LILPVFLCTCSTKKNTATTRNYHAINTKYNIYFNANESYKEALKQKEESHQDTLSQLLDIYPISPAKAFDGESGFSSTTSSYTPNRRNEGIAGFFSPQSGNSDSQQSYSSGGGGSFSRSIEKNTKAIKLHSIKARPERNRNRMKDPKYQAWLQQQEFNPFLHNAWLLLGKSEYHDGDYLQAASTFSYITRIYKPDPEIVAEARMWMAKSNIAMGWMYEAEDIFNQIRLAGGIPEKLKPEYNKIYADFLIRKGEYRQAIPFLEQAIESEGDRLQRTRMKYLLGQIYKREGNREAAYKAFDSVHGLSTPYLYSFNARIQQASFVDSSNKQDILKLLNKMGKDHKNKEYLDQVYYAIGNIYLNDNDTVKAIENYRLSVEKSTRNGQDKALTEVVLGDIYFRQREYIKAQPVYSDALNILSKRHEDYPLVALRSAVLDELVVYAKAVHLQDSLQTLARMPEGERIYEITKLIEEIKRKEKEEKDRAEREERMARREENMPDSSPLFEQNTPQIPTSPILTGNMGGNTDFYFYNPQVVAQGKAAFQRKWGTRKLEDNWRRKNKQSSLISPDTPVTLDDVSVNQPDTTSLDPSGGTIPAEQQTAAVDDIYSVEFYLQQIPLTPEAMKASDDIIEDAYFNMGMIYKDKLGDYSLAIEAFNTDLNRFPDTPNLEEIYYQLFLIYLKLGDQDMMALYRRNLLAAFPEGKYSAALRDENYEWNMLNMYQMEDNLYQETYELYLAGKTAQVRANYQTMKEKYPLSGLMPKFSFLNSLTYAQTNDLDKFKETLTELVAAYPQADVTPLASEMLKGILGGKALSSDSSPFRGMIWDIKLKDESVDSSGAGVEFVAGEDATYMLMLLFPPGSVDKNQLIYEVANYNFSNYVFQTFDLAFVNLGQLDVLQIRGFSNFEEISNYVKRAFEENSLMANVDPGIIPVPISTDNYIALMNGKTLNEYFTFFGENYSNDMPVLIRYWNTQKGETEAIATETPDEEEPLPVTDETEQVDQPQIIPETIPSKVDTVKKVVPQEIPLSPLLPKPELFRDSLSNKKGFGVGDIMSDDQIDKADDIINKATEIFNNPVDRLMDVFKSSGDSNDSDLTKEEKEAQKQAEKERRDQEKARQAEERAKQRALEEAEKLKQDSIQNIDRQRLEADKAIQKAREEEAKAIEKAKKDAAKQREQEWKDREKAQKEAQKQREKERKEELKRKEQERKERLQQRERERKEKLRQREQELKERERQAKSKN